MNLTVAALALALLLGADAPASPVPTAEPPSAPAPQLKRVTVQFHKIAPADPAKRSGRRMEMNRRYSPLVVVTRPDGSQIITHGPQQEIELLEPAERPR